MSSPRRRFPVIKSRMVWGAAAALTVLLAGCSSGDADTAPSTSQSPPPATGPSMIGGPAAFVPGTTQVSGAGVDGAEASWTVTVDAIEWVWADQVHGDMSTAWIPSAEVYLAAEVEYTAVEGAAIYSTADWSFGGDNGVDGILGEAGSGGSEEGKGLEVVGELAEGETVRGRVYFGLPAATAGTLVYSTLAGGEQGEWSVPTQ